MESKSIGCMGANWWLGCRGAAAMARQVTARASAHVHVGYEHISYPSRAQVDDAVEHPANGTLLVYMPGTWHTVRSLGGCVGLIIWERPVSFVAQEKLKEALPW